jgi:arginine decarboxylase
MILVPSEMIFTKGVGRHKERLASFEMALRDAGIATYNLVYVSSIFPPHCKVVTKQSGLAKLPEGAIVHVVMSQAQMNEPHRLMAASVGVAIPRNQEIYGYLSEHHSYGEREKVAGDYAEDLAAAMMATTLGVPFDPDASWNEKKEIWRISGHIVTTRNVTQTAVGDKQGRWTTVLAAAVFSDYRHPDAE